LVLSSTQASIVRRVGLVVVTGHIVAGGRSAGLAWAGLALRMTLGRRVRPTRPFFAVLKIQARNASDRGNPVQLGVLEIVVLDDLLRVFCRLILGYGARAFITASPSLVASRLIGCPP
jgi:hypothetical protein